MYDSSKDAVAVFTSNVTPPPRERASLGQAAGRWLLGLTIVAALVGSVVIARPALTVDHSAPTQQSQRSQQPQASQGH
ncbi:hypothetical protein [Streptomyces sp. DSM 15324]|uniref:hypothetical protein n=1 Tax=Streptomyces sp. DSM 15324 TaxID=1739111 RepID=UPI0007465F28|nr:hypothetical protein [Streptomyces sp. DSM 15324]KUO07527.1 hypothetical protein AQJ58_35125 [Streptomyces sp. DSM 15324]